MALYKRFFLVYLLTYSWQKCPKLLLHYYYNRFTAVWILCPKCDYQ